MKAAAKPARARRAKPALFWGGSLEHHPTQVTAEARSGTAQLVTLVLRHEGLEGRVFLSLPDHERLHAELGRLLTARRSEVADLDRQSAEEASADYAAATRTTTAPSPE